LTKPIILEKDFPLVPEINIPNYGIVVDEMLDEFAKEILESDTFIDELI